MKPKEAIIQLMCAGGQDQLVVDALDLAIEALEKQVTKKPLVYTDTRNKLSWDGYDDGTYDVNCYMCPDCGSYISDCSETEEYKYKPCFCPVCGQALDWEVKPNE